MDVHGTCILRHEFGYIALEIIFVSNNECKKTHTQNKCYCGSNDLCISTVFLNNSVKCGKKSKKKNTGFTFDIQNTIITVD